MIMASRQVTQREQETRSEPQRQRRHVPLDRFELAADAKAPGLTYQWVTKSVMGAEDVDNQIIMREAGWTVVNWEDLPAHTRPPNLTPDTMASPVEKGGAILMCRPDYLGKEAMLEDFQRAREQVRDKLAELRNSPENHAPRPDAEVKVSRTYAPPVGGEIPADDS
jgi:hypothetical protein